MEHFFFQASDGLEKKKCIHWRNTELDKNIELRGFTSFISRKLESCWRRHANYNLNQNIPTPPPRLSLILSHINSLILHRVLCRELHMLVISRSFAASYVTHVVTRSNKTVSSLLNLLVVTTCTSRNFHEKIDAESHEKVAKFARERAGAVNISNFRMLSKHVEN